MPKQSDINAKKTSFFRWLDLPKEQRFPSTYVDKAKELGVRPQTLNRWERDEYPSWGKQQKGDGAVDITNLSYEEMVALWKSIMVELMQGKKGTAEDRKTFGKYLGLLIDKSEQRVKITLDADELFRIESESQRELADFQRGRGLHTGSQGDTEVPTEPALLSVEIREDKGQAEGDNPV